jgi:hypothetical protein
MIEKYYKCQACSELCILRVQLKIYFTKDAPPQTCPYQIRRAKWELVE